MGATSLKLPDELKKRIDALVKRGDTTAHAFMVEAIRQATERAERREIFLEEARQAEVEVLRSGKAFDVEEVFDYLETKVRGKKAQRPKPRAWRRSV
jgi:predicted transcriptional regulator